MSTENCDKRAALLVATRYVPLCKINKRRLEKLCHMKRVLFVENLVTVSWKVGQCHFSCIAGMVELLFVFSLGLCLMLLVMTVSF